MLKRKYTLFKKKIFHSPSFVLIVKFNARPRGKKNWLCLISHYALVCPLEAIARLNPKRAKKKSRNSVWFCKKMICRRPRCFPRLYYSSSRVVWDAIKRLRGAIYWSLVWGTPLIALMGGGVTSALVPLVQPESWGRRSVISYENLVAKRNYCRAYRC